MSYSGGRETPACLSAASLALALNPKFSLELRRKYKSRGKLAGDGFAVRCAKFCGQRFPERRARSIEELASLLNQYVCSP